jgi:hypothetical protein
MAPARPRVGNALPVAFIRPSFPNSMQPAFAEATRDGLGKTIDVVDHAVLPYVLDRHDLKSRQRRARSQPHPGMIA